MPYRTEATGTEYVLIDGRGRELASFEVETDGDVLQLTVGHGLIDTTTDDEPEGVKVFMLVPEEDTP